MKDPRDIPDSDMPLIVFSDNSSGWLEFIIKFRTKGYWNHIMFCRKKGFFVSQGNTYSEVGMERYMKKGSELKFIRIIGLTNADRESLLESIEKKLKSKWYRKMYDWVGILGQAIGIKKLNTPGLNYCSEDVTFHLKNIAMFCNKPLSDVLIGIPDHTSPEGMNEYFKSNPECFEVYGKWDADDS